MRALLWDRSRGEWQVKQRLAQEENAAAPRISTMNSNYVIYLMDGIDKNEHQNHTAYYASAPHTVLAPRLLHSDMQISLLLYIKAICILNVDILETYFQCRCNFLPFWCQPLAVAAPFRG